jgi:hypothetical protein
MKKRRRCPFLWAGFGLSKEYVEKGTYEEIFTLMQHGKWSFTEAYSLPNGLRKWFVERLIRHFEEKSKQQ